MSSFFSSISDLDSHIILLRDLVDAF